MYIKKAYVSCKILFLLSVAVFLVSCLSWVMEKPSFVLRGVSLRPLSLTDVNLLLDLDVQNPNRFDLNFKSFDIQPARDVQKSVRNKTITE